MASGNAEKLYQRGNCVVPPSSMRTSGRLTQSQPSHARNSHSASITTPSSASHRCRVRPESARGRKSMLTSWLCWTRSDMPNSVTNTSNCTEISSAQNSGALKK